MRNGRQNVDKKKTTEKKGISNATRHREKKVLAPDGLAKKNPKTFHAIFFVNEDIRTFDLHQTDGKPMQRFYILILFVACAQGMDSVTTTWTTTTTTAANDLIWFIESF